jgi:hypothetical protein
LGRFFINEGSVYTAKTPTSLALNVPAKLLWSTASASTSTTNTPSAGPLAIIKEVARTILVRHNFTADDITSSQERFLLFQQLIPEAQGKAEREALRIGAEWFVSDQSGVDSIAYAAQHLGEGGR